MENLPQHIAFIMDGNGRWATAQGLSRLKGHEEGAKTLRATVQRLVELGISTASFFVFSSENWRRPKAEVQGLMLLLERYLQTEYAVFKKHNIQVRILGDLGETSLLSPRHRNSMRALMEKTVKHTGLVLNLCINYGGQDDILRAAKKVFAQLNAGDLTLEALTPHHFETQLDTHTLPPIDLCIRTGGECRLSNFMLWQLSYAEFFFSPTFWPGFSQEELSAILQNYAHRQRRFGKLPTPLTAEAMTAS